MPSAERVWQHDVTALLRRRNVLQLKLDTNKADQPAVRDITLEIRCTAYLRDVGIRLSHQGRALRLQASGKVFGTAERDLELYLLAGDARVAYSVIKPQPQGSDFELSSEELHAHTRRVAARLELINGAVVWYELEQTVEMSE
jgi:hypothetical protein